MIGGRGRTVSQSRSMNAEFLSESRSLVKPSVERVYAAASDRITSFKTGAGARIWGAQYAAGGVTTWVRRRTLLLEWLG